MLTSPKCDMFKGYKYITLDFPEIYDTVQSRWGTVYCYKCLVWHCKSFCHEFHIKGKNGYRLKRSEI